MWAHTKTHPIEESTAAYCEPVSGKKKTWREFFEKELEMHGEQGFYLKGLRLREGYTCGF